MRLLVGWTNACVFVIMEIIFGGMPTSANVKRTTLADVGGRWQVLSAYRIDADISWLCIYSAKGLAYFELDYFTIFQDVISNEARTNTNEREKYDCQIDFESFEEVFLY